MCLRVYLTRGAVFTDVALLIASVLVMFSGSLIAIDIHAEWAYGYSINIKAMFVVVFAAITFISTCCGFYGAVNHNKFCLLLFWCVQLVCQITQGALAKSIQLQIAPDYDDDFVRGCLGGTNKIEWDDFGAERPDRTTGGETTDACAAFWRHDKRIKLENLWYQMYRLGIEDEQYVQMMEGWQDTHECCGFGPPQKCFMPLYEAVADTAWEGCPSRFCRERAHFCATHALHCCTAAEWILIAAHPCFVIPTTGPVSFDPDDVEPIDPTQPKEERPFHAKCPPLGCGKNDGWYVPTVNCEQIVVVGMREFMGGCRPSSSFCRASTFVQPS